MASPWADVRVLDLSQFLSGPRAAQILSMLGADVVKVESPTGDTMRLIMAMTGSQRGMHAMHHGKRGAVVDLWKPAGAAVVRRLAAQADVVIENFAPGAAQRLGLDYDQLAPASPRLIYASIRGFGRSGPLADRTAFDLIAQATGGTMYANHQPDRPPGVFFADLCAGAFAAIGILAALYERQQTGRGKLIDVSMQDVMYFHNFWAFSERATAPDRENIRGILGGSMQSLLSDPDNPMPFWNSYVAADGHVAIVALTDRQWRALMDVIGRPDMADDPRFANLVERIRHAPDATRIVSAWTAARPVSEVVSALAARQIPCGPVNDYDALNQDPQLAARGMLATAAHLAYGEVAVPGFPLQFDGQTAPIKPGPELAEHTDAVLRDWLNLPDEEIITLRKRGIIV